MSDDIEIGNGTFLRLGDVTLTFQRTLRVPDDGQRYPLPPGLGCFPLRRVSDYADRVPADWVDQGGVFLPMYQREAMWLSFSGPDRALKVGVGKVCAISGERWREGLRASPQNYVVTGTQPWLDGIASGAGTIRQFVAMPLGMGYTVEAQVTGEERYGGIQLQLYRPRRGTIPSFGGPYRCAGGASGIYGGPPPAPGPAPSRRGRQGAMGLAAGGQMKQKIYPDPWGVGTWDPSDRTRVFVHIVNSDLWREITGEPPPPTPVTARTYSNAGLPWFDLYDEGAASLRPPEVLRDVASVGQIDQAQLGTHLQDDGPLWISPVKKLIHSAIAKLRVSDGDW